MTPIPLIWYHHDINYYIIFSLWILQQPCWCPKDICSCPFSTHFHQSFRGWLSCEALAEEGWIELPSPAARLSSKMICRVMQGTPVPVDPSELPHPERMCCSVIPACSAPWGSSQQLWWYLLDPLTGSALHRVKPLQMELHKDTIYWKLLASKTESRSSETSVLLVWQYFENLENSAGSRTSGSQHSSGIPWLGTQHFQPSGTVSIFGPYTAAAPDALAGFPSSAACRSCTGPSWSAQIKSCLAVLLSEGEQWVKILISQQNWEIGQHTNKHLLVTQGQREKGGSSSWQLVPLCAPRQPDPGHSLHLRHERTWSWPNWDPALPGWWELEPLFTPC